MRAMLSLCVLLLVGLTACARDKIPGTDVEDSPEARDVVTYVEQYRVAVTSRSVGKLLQLASSEYYDDMGTPAGDDDVDKQGLAERLKDTFAGDLLSVHYDIRYRDVIFLPTKVLVDYTYIGRFRIQTPDGTRWERRLADNRLVLRRHKEGRYDILSGM